MSAVTGHTLNKRNKEEHKQSTTQEEKQKICKAHAPKQGEQAKAKEKKKNIAAA